MKDQNETLISGTIQKYRNIVIIKTTVHEFVIT